MPTLSSSLGIIASLLLVASSHMTVAWTATSLPLSHSSSSSSSPFLSTRRLSSTTPTPHTSRTCAALSMSTTSDDKTNNNKRRVVVTGLGVINGCGSGHDDFFANCCAGQSSIQRVTRFDITPYPCQIGSVVPENMFDPADWFVNPKNIKSNDRYTHFAVASARQALRDAGLGDTPDTLSNPARVGVMVGTAFGGIETIEKEILKLNKNPDKPRVSPFTVPAYLANTASGVVGIETGAQGPNYAIVSACAAGSHAIGEAAGMIADGHVDIMLAGGSEATMNPISFAGFCAMKAMSTAYNDNPTAGSRPFDQDRGGFVMAEGAGVIVLESLESALARGADIYCEMVGYGATCDAHHITTPAPEGRGLAAGMEMCLSMAGMDKTDVSYINAHGTSTAYNDKFETMAIKTVFGDHAADTSQDGHLVVSSTKCVTGHALGAAGGLEAVIIAKAIKENVVPPTINYVTPDPECDLDYVPNVKREMEVKAAMSTNLGFGGHNAAILFKKYEA